jgi:mannitol-specific phosphotransferase system IIBC component
MANPHGLAIQVHMQPILSIAFQLVRLARGHERQRTKAGIADPVSPVMLIAACMALAQRGLRLAGTKPVCLGFRRTQDSPGKSSITLN